MTCGQVWCPILGICVLAFNPPSAKTQQWTHARTHNARSTHAHMHGTLRTHAPARTPRTHPVNTNAEHWAAILLRRSSGGFGAFLKGLTSVVVLKVERALVIHSPHRQFLPDLRFGPVTFGYKSDSLSIRSWLPLWSTINWLGFSRMLQKVTETLLASGVPANFSM